MSVKQLNTLLLLLFIVFFSNVWVFNLNLHTQKKCVIKIKDQVLWFVVMCCLWFVPRKTVSWRMTKNFIRFFFLQFSRLFWTFTPTWYVLFSWSSRFRHIPCVFIEAMKRKVNKVLWLTTIPYSMVFENRCGISHSDWMWCWYPCQFVFHARTILLSFTPVSSVIQSIFNRSNKKNKEPKTEFNVQPIGDLHSVHTVNSEVKCCTQLMFVVLPMATHTNSAIVFLWFACQTERQ